MPLESETVLISTLKRVKLPDFLDVYANNANTSFGFQDLRLVFGQITMDPDTTTPYITDRVAVTMNWEHAKSLRDLLDRLVKKYEEEIGPIRSQPE